MIYSRDARKAMDLTAGLDLMDRGIMSMLVDLMIIHQEHGGVPAEPPNYIAGMLGCGQRRWAEHVAPRLIKAHKIKRVTRNGIEVYILDEKFSPIVSAPAPAAVPALAPTLPPEAFADAEERALEVLERASPEMKERWLNARKEIAAARLQDGAPPATHPFDDRMDAISSQTRRKAAEIVSQPNPVFEKLVGLDTLDEKPAEAEAPPVPMPSAYEILKAAGLDPEEHPRGAFYWARQEHGEILKDWLQKIPLSEITHRLAKAVHEGRAPDVQPNSLRGYERCVF